MEGDARCATEKRANPSMNFAQQTSRDKKKTGPCFHPRKMFGDSFVDSNTPFVFFITQTKQHTHTHTYTGKDPPCT